MRWAARSPSCLHDGGHAAWLAPYARILGIVLGFVLISFIQIVIGELVPKRLALSAPEKFSGYAAFPMLVLSRLTAPFVWLLNVSSNALLRLMRVNQHGRGVVTEEEIRMLVAESAEQGVLDPDEHNMVNRVLRLGDRTVDSVMTPRMRIAWLDIAAPREENVEVLRQTPYSRYPVYRGDESDVVGVVEVKRLLHSFADGKLELFEHLSKPLFVPATARALDLLEEFRDAETPLALVVDEYGDIEGVVTVNDLLAAVVGASQIGHGSDAETPDRAARGRQLADRRQPFHRRPARTAASGSSTRRKRARLPHRRRHGDDRAGPHPADRRSVRMAWHPFRGGRPRRCAHRQAAGDADCRV
jgi:putative hemolysin